MEITYTFGLIFHKKESNIGLFEDVVTYVLYNYTGTDEIGNTYTYSNGITLALPTNIGFLPYNELSEENFGQWIFQIEPIEEIEAKIKTQIKKIRFSENYRLSDFLFEPNNSKF